MSIIRIIKKYPNRRLYDTDSSRYITLDEIRGFVLSRTPFQVIDAKTGEDLTNPILLQVISTQESGKSPFLTTEILQGIIRFHDNPLSQPIGAFIEKAFAFAAEHQDNFSQCIKEFSVQPPSFDQLSQMAQKNMAFWQDFFQKSGGKGDKNQD